MLIIGCDPGINGAIAALDNGRLAAVHDMPTLSIKVGGKNRNVVDENQLNVVIRGLLAECVVGGNDHHFVLEEVGAMPNEGAVGAFSFGRGYGAIRGVLAGLQVPRTHIRPDIWKRQLKLRKGKDASRQRAMELFPEWTKNFSLKKHDGRAEAALIAYWARAHLPALDSAPEPEHALL